MLKLKAGKKSATSLPKLKVPAHVAIIMDGNGRWAKKRHLPRFAGHKRGADVVRDCVEASLDLGIRYLTLYAFSSENWKRSTEEVSDLMSLLRLYLRREIDDLDKNGVYITTIGDRSRLAPDIVELIVQAEKKTQNNKKLQLTLALNYGGQAEIVHAVKQLVRDAKDGKVSDDDINEECVARYLYTNGMPDPDLIIRTSGEKRLSNFLLWQAAYTEFAFLDVLWPDFTKESLIEAVTDFSQRDRRYGAR
ncbi:MAG: di-trans,poly-cis-decaprenylcistransferase [Kordiimonas sp.]|nr:di-trans,poly-cis-decaprenylcistransferase [Kordiimonas sp.]